MNSVRHPAIGGSRPRLRRMAGIEASDAGTLETSSGSRRVRLAFAVALGFAALVLVVLGMQAAQREPTCGEVIMEPGGTCDVQVQPDGSLTTFVEARAEDQDASKRFLLLGGLSAVCAVGLLAASRARRPTVARSGLE